MRFSLALAILVTGLTLPVDAQPSTPRPTPVAAASGAQGVRTPTTAERFEAAWYQWDAGAYDSALVNLKAVLAAPDANAFHDRVAELTGEIYQTTLVAENATAPNWSPDGQYLAYVTGTGAAARTVVVRAAGLTKVAEVAGAGYRLFGGTPLRAARISGGGFGANAAPATLTVGPLGGAPEWTFPNPEGLSPTDVLIPASGSRFVVVVAGRAAGPFQPREMGYVVVDGQTVGPLGKAAAVAISADGSTIAHTEVSGDTVTCFVQRGTAPATKLGSIVGRAQSLALSPNGRVVAWSQMVREDWEIFTAPTDGSGAATRLTHEIQHDLFPQFINDSTVLAVIGEGRHRRSYLYNIATGARTRLFHNNTVRTVAPEYEWAVAPDGLRVAISSERDGDTITPHRHLWLTDMRQKVTRAMLVARVDSMLGAERELRARGRTMFAPIEARVREATQQVSVARIYENEKALFAFDSKHITQPGNARAAEYLLQKYREYGLEARLQYFDTPGTAGATIRTANVIATVQGTVNPELVYVVGAHFDSRAEGPGADDNTSGTTMILEAARLIAKYPLPATVMFVAFTGEESGLRGSRAFAAAMKDSIHVVGALNNDMMGWSNDHRLDNTIRYSNAGLRDVQHAAAIGFSSLVTYDAFYYKSTDAHALYDAWGDIVAGIGSYPILGNPHYHMSHDALETVNHRQLAETSKATLATIMLMASSPSRLTSLMAQGKTVTWNPAVERDVTRYLVQYGPASNPTQYRKEVRVPRAVLDEAQPGWVVQVKAVNDRGLEGWDWVRGEFR